VHVSDEIIKLSDVFVFQGSVFLTRLKLPISEVVEQPLAKLRGFFVTTREGGGQCSSTLIFTVMVICMYILYNRQTYIYCVPEWQWSAGYG